VDGRGKPGHDGKQIDAYWQNYLAILDVRRRDDGARGSMSLLSFLLNVLWVVCGGLYMAIAWVIAGVVMAITIIGLPWARAAFNIALYTLLPFGQKAVARAEHTGREDVGTGPLGLLGNIIWLVLAGWWLALGHIITALLLAVTIIGIPFAWAHLKLAGIALWPIGKMIVPADAHDEIGVRPHGAH
jgi:uncharacterized membrane protein YccF (DUF307 family)